LSVELILKHKMGKFQFMSIGSSSGGNCYYVGTTEYGFLIDAGISVRTVKKALKEHKIDFENIYGIFLTHDHTDHVKYAGILAEKHNLPIFATQEVFDGINSNGNVEPKVASQNRKIFKKYDITTIKDFIFQSFPVSHDASDAMGYAITFKNKKLVIATDLGYISKEVADHISKANYLVIEANYDDEMLKSGPYPYNLKQRVRSHTGHLSNKHTAKFLADNWHKDLTHIFLCHISGENNTNELAYDIVKEALDEKNITLKIFTALPRLTPTEMYILNL